MASLKNAMLYNPLVKTIGINNSKEIKKTIPDPIKEKNSSKPLTIEKLVDYVKKLYINPSNSLVEDKENINKESIPHELVLLNKGDIEVLVSDYLGKNLADLFDGQNISRYGIINTKEMKVSFISAILTCIKPGFLLLSDKEQINYVTCIKNMLTSRFQGSAFKFYRNLDWNKKKLLIDIDNLDTSEEFIRAISDLFFINIFIIDIEEDTVDVFGGDKFIPFKKNVFLIKHDRNTFESLFFKNSTNDDFMGFISDNHDLIRSLIESNDFVSFNPVDLRDPTKIHKLEPLFYDNLDQYSPEIQVKLEKKDRDLDRIISNQLNNLQKIENTTSSESSKAEKETSLKMKLEELVDIAMKYKIDLKYKDEKGKEKKKTKQMLYNEIIEHQ
jgi:hypothetical protein